MADFQALAAEDREDGLAAFYVERCAARERQQAGWNEKRSIASAYVDRSLHTHR
jgi:hypothetical protein